MATNVVFTNGELIRKARIDAGLDQAQLGTRIGVRRETICAWERDKRDPSARQLKAIEAETGSVWLWGQLRRKMNGLDLHLRDAVVR